MRKRILVLFISLMMVLGMVGVMPQVPVNASGTIYWPVPGHTTLSQGWHNGNAIDISDGNIAGADVIASCGGTVCAIFLCGEQHYGSEADCHGFGTGLAINGDDGRVYQYAHMQANSIPGDVYYGAYVSAGQKIGQVGTTGNSSGYHLHFGISLEKYWYASGINPANESYIYNTHTCSYTSTVTKNPTCTETGVRTYTCSCGSSYTEDIAATGHSYTSVVTPVTSTSKGYTTHTCSDCSYSYTDSYIDAPVLGDDGWYYCDALPSDISSDEYTIQYNNISEKISETSPGNDWTNEGIASTEWRNSGEQYTSETALETSDARVLVKECYYHWCIPGAGMTTEGNYEWTSYFSHYDEIVLPNDYVHVTSTGDDNGHTYYLLAWTDGSQVYCKSGEQCDGTQETHGYRCRAWYKHYVYQDRVQVTTYRFTKETGWVSEIDSTADSTACRYRLKGIDWNTKGDINQNSAITLSDTVLLQKYLLNLEPLTSSQMEIADINSDGRVNVLDICLLKAHLT